jgi:hypothetical protein
VEVVRPLRVIALILLAVASSGFQSVVVALAVSFIAVIKNLLPVTVVVEPIETKRIVWTIRPYYNHTTRTSLRGCGGSRNHESANQQYCGQNKSNDSAKLFLAHNLPPFAS